jgi:hypothetical protein
MKIVLTCLMLIATIPTLARSDSPSQVQDAARVASVAVSVSGAEVRAMVTEKGRGVTLSVGGKGAVHVGLPESESVSEIRIGPWMNSGIALAIETRNSETNEVSYFWSTAWVNLQESQVAKPVVGRFLKTKIDYDVVGVVNSQSDSICITLLRHQRANDSQSFDGQIYVNNCPVGADVQGVLLPLAVNSIIEENER